MRGFRFELLLATTALTLVVVGSGLPSFAAPDGEAEISAAVPMPEPANLPPPTAADLVPLGTEPATGATPPAQTASAPPGSSGNPPAIGAPATTPAAAEAPAPTAEPPVLTVDQRIGEKIRDLFAGKFERVIDRRYKPAIEAFYSARGYAPLWIADGAENDRAKAVTAFLAGTDADGLDPSDYPAPSFASSDLASLAEAELRFSATVLTYARHAQLGRVHYSRVSADISYDQVPPEPAAVLGKVATAEDVDKALESYNPPQPGYKALKAKLAEARGKDGGASAPRIGGGAALKVGMSDPRVPALRERLGVAGEPGDLAYDKPLAEAVKKFQRQRDLPQTGVLNGATVDALNGQRHDRDADLIIANMERWRWIPRDLGNAYVVVNIPDFTLRVMDHGTQVWTTRVVTGQPGEKATPLLSETMKYITVNPTWNVPPSIINNEYLPAYEQDNTVLDRMGLKMERNRDGTVRIYQPPGETNALGRLRFNFPNKFLVYQHDTPDKHLFALDKRAFSHGCMRVQYPDKYAEVLLNIANPKDGYTAEKIRKMYGSNERDIQLQTPIPVHLTYQTAFVDDAGRLETRADIYGRDSRLLAALKSEDRRIAEIPIEHKETSVQAKDIPVDRGSTIASNRRQAMRMPAQQQGPGQPSFFLFGLFR